MVRYVGYFEPFQGCWHMRGAVSIWVHGLVPQSFPSPTLPRSMPQTNRDACCQASPHRGLSKRRKYFADPHRLAMVEATERTPTRSLRVCVLLLVP